MGLNIDEAIKHAREVAETNRYKAKTYDDDFLKRFHTNTDKCKQCAEEHEQLVEWLEKLKAYEQAEEDGLLKMLPVAIGSDVYFIPSKANYDLNNLCKHEGLNRVYHQKVARIVFTECGWYIECSLNLQYGITDLLRDESYKETWFTTEAEAEHALAKMKGV